MQGRNYNNSIVLNDEGSFSPETFSWRDFTIALLPKTDAKLSIFYVDFIYKNEITKDIEIMIVPHIDVEILTKGINEIESAQKVGKNGLNSLLIPFWGKDQKAQCVLHPLGGCPMGETVNDGVVNGLGKVFNATTGQAYNDLYVVDGSIIATALGVNPSLPISALAFRIAEHIVGETKQHWPQ